MSKEFIMIKSAQIKDFPAHSQRGFVLIVALVLLLVLTILGLAAAQSTSLEERMAGNARNRDMAFQAAEAGLRAAESCLNTGLAVCSSFSTNANGTYLFNPSAPPPPSTLTTPLWEVPGFWSTAGNVLSYATITGANLQYVATQPEIIIEQLPAIAAPGGNIGQQQFGGGSPTIQNYRITVLGTGGDSSATAMLQAIN
ncbi:MAG TPA: PilX N-terminal domain-containing pilus assembly protein [Gammaproteobacteria bacterium]|nr:PilX N-terminal domain-containing pilus assembly protein [Gammaproteobacteria bacterium]